MQRTSLQPEEYCYPAGGFTRTARVILTPNPHNPIVLPYGEIRTVRASIPDTYFSIPARLRYRGKTVKGFISQVSNFRPDYTDNPDAGELSFTPEANPAACLACKDGEGCRR